MKNTFVALVLMSTSFQAFSQDRCELRVQKLQEKISENNNQLAICQSNGGGSSSEVTFLRNENARLIADNQALQVRINQLEGRGYEQFLCAAGCVDAYGKIDTRYMTTGLAYTQLEADMNEKKETQKKYSCNYGVKTYQCESFSSDRQVSYCAAGCVDAYGKVDERYSNGARGRNRLEAEILALKEVQNQYKCNYGVKIISCN